MVLHGIRICKYEELTNGTKSLKTLKATHCRVYVPGQSVFNLYASICYITLITTVTLLRPLQALWSAYRSAGKFPSTLSPAG